MSLWNGAFPRSPDKRIAHGAPLHFSKISPTANSVAGTVAGESSKLTAAVRRFDKLWIPIALRNLCSEQLTLNQRVQGSSPCAPTSNRFKLNHFFESAVRGPYFAKAQIRKNKGQPAAY